MKYKQDKVFDMLKQAVEFVYSHNHENEYPVIMGICHRLERKIGVTFFDSFNPDDEEESFIMLPVSVYTESEFVEDFDLFALFRKVEGRNEIARYLSSEGASTPQIPLTETQKEGLDLVLRSATRPLPLDLSGGD